MVSVTELLNDQAINAYLLRMIGEEGIELLKRFPEGEEHSDEELAEMTEINLNTVRHTLYTLYEKRLAEYRRLKNTETGWLTYLWHLRLDRLQDVIEEEIRDVLEHLDARLTYEEKNDFYICKNCGVIYTFTDAAEWNFECPNCEEMLEHFDNELIATALRRRVEKIKESLGSA
ncbi:transcription initiation factor TFIIE alpha subunit [Methanoculleus bourgensis MS2]|uniref:Transcription factor E n=1 Tax=Methanoculleus bourgensis (strain ATCC 43281 / DSM 3045 / OCM 15 / MS2) TaxID=1201294 RepID=I7J9R3_METBM|nr:transcription factor [Methanoculleus bourgensis]CCJ36783.1 transcription initiation factor TFIIE alpha subunit [Methanoculleus bourgensis MS2]